MAIDRIEKYRLLTNESLINVSAEHVFMQAGIDVDGHVCLWFAIDKVSRAIPMKIFMLPSGKLPNVGSYLGTVKDGAIIWHIFTDAAAGVTRNHEFHYITRDNA